MPAITAFDVAIGTDSIWYPVEIVTVDMSRDNRGGLPASGKEYRYWRISVTEAGVTENVEGRLLIAGPSHPSPSPALVVALGQHRTWTRVVTANEDIISRAGNLSVE